MNNGLTWYDRVAHLVGLAALGLITVAGAMATPDAAGVVHQPIPGWLMIVASVVAFMTSSTTKPIMSKPTVGEAVRDAKIGVVLLAFLSLGLSSCATFAPITDACEDCIDPQVSAASASLVPTGKAILSCAISAIASPVLPECVIDGLEALIQSLPDGLRKVDCMIDRIANGRGTAANPRVQATARAWLSRRASAGMVLRTTK